MLHSTHYHSTPWSYSSRIREISSESCLARQAKELVAEAEENNLGEDVLSERWERWETCSLCGLYFHSDVAHALGWACWKTYLGRPESDEFRKNSMVVLAWGLRCVGRYEEAVVICDAYRELNQRDPEKRMNVVMTLQLTNTESHCLSKLRRYDDALDVDRWALRVATSAYGELDVDSLEAANNLGQSLADLGRYQEARTLLHDSLQKSKDKQTLPQDFVQKPKRNQAFPQDCSKIWRKSRISQAMPKNDKTKIKKDLWIS